MCESRGENKALIKDLAELRLLYRDAQEDIQLLHDALAKQKNCNCGLKAGTNGMDPRQDLISQLERNQEKVEMRHSLHFMLTCTLFELHKKVLINLRHHFYVSYVWRCSLYSY